MTEQERTNRAWFDRLYAEQYLPLYNHACWRLHKLGLTGGMLEELAHDAVQLSFTVAWEQAEALQAMEHPRAWLFRVLQNKLTDSLREEQRLRQLQQRLTERRTEACDTENAEFRLFLSAHLSPEDQHLAGRIYIDGECPSDLCREMGIKRSALSMRLRRIHQKLEKFLK